MRKAKRWDKENRTAGVWAGSVSSGKKFSAGPAEKSLGNKTAGHSKKPEVLKIGWP